MIDLEARNLRIALSQPRSPAGDEAGAMAAIERVLATADSAGAHLAVLPELFLPGYNAEDMQARAQTMDGPWVKALSQMTLNAGCGVVVGYAEREGEAVFNSVIAIGADGVILAHHRKLQLYGAREARLFAEGTELSTFEMMGQQLSLLICYDVEFSHHVRALALKGAEIVIAPSANSEPFVTDVLLRGHAMTNGVIIVYVNYCGAEGDQPYCGGTSVFGQDGAVLAQAGTGPALLIVDLPVPELAADVASHLTDHREL